MKTPILEMKGITKRFPNVVANEDVDVELYPGEVLALLGENGAGKSTLMKILAGFSLPTRGTIRVDGAAVDYRNPARAADLGIGMLYQDPLDFPLLTVLDNFMLGQTKGLNPQRKNFRRQFGITGETGDLCKSMDAGVCPAGAGHAGR